MNTYEISFQRSNGTAVTDRVVAATPGEAKKLFKEIYRHSEEFWSKDLKVELVAEGVIGELADYCFTTTGNGTSYNNSKEFGKAIAAALKADNVQGVILTST